MAMIKVGSKTHQFMPKVEGYNTIVVTVRNDSEWYKIGPYYLKDENNYLFENIWQFHKVYQSVPCAFSGYSQASRNRTVWIHPAEVHVNPDGSLTNEYFAWRQKGLNNRYPVRYPLWNIHTSLKGYNSIRKPLCHYYNQEKYNYIEARKNIYLKEYIRLVKKTKEFEVLSNMLKTTKLLIVEWDGPQNKLINYYKEKYGVDDNFIIGNTMDATKENLSLMLNDEKSPFGHGYCLATALLNLELD